MIVRATPRSPFASWGHPMTYRERWYVLAARRAGYSTRRIGRHLRGRDRYQKIREALGLPGTSKVSKAAMPEPDRLVEMPRDSLFRCQDCGDLIGRTVCRCGWVAGVA